MFLHAGNNKSIKLSRIIGIFDMDTSTVSRETKKFVRNFDKSGNAVYISSEIPKSFILCDDKKIYASQISPSALCKRSALEEISVASETFRLRRSKLKVLKTDNKK